MLKREPVELLVPEYEKRTDYLKWSNSLPYQGRRNEGMHFVKNV